MRRKREGVSLIYVIIIFMFVSMVSAAMLSMVSANYRGRVAENKRIENLYGADSGIDVAYNIIGKTFDAASMYGYYCRKELFDKDEDSNSTYNKKYKSVQDDIELLKVDIETLENEISVLNNSESPNKNEIKKKNNDIAKKNELIQEDNEILNSLLNEEFKIAFANFIKATENVGDGNYVNGKLKDCLTNGKYFDKVSLIGSYDEVFIDYPTSANGLKPDLSQSKIEPIEIGKEPKVTKEGHHENVNIDICKYKYTISVISNFESNTNVAIGTNTRTIQANYTLTVPNYDDVFFGKGSTIHNKYLALEGRGLTVGGNMNVENVDTLNVDGNIFVNGQVDPNNPVNDDTANRTYQKYYGGISLNKASNVEFAGDVITRNTFNVQDHVNATINGNLYASNAYLGKIAAGDSGFSENSTFNISNNNGNGGKVILDNDLTMKANNSNITMNDFYGINDKNIIYKGNNLGTADKVKSSSSIIINKPKDVTYNSTIKINNLAYIMGTAHIATENNYQTAESGAVKGNYEAYSVPLLDRSEEFDYDKPLYLLKENDVFKKAEHFKNYWDNKGNGDNGGIIWPNKEDIHSIGSIVYQDKSILPPNYTQSLELEGGDVYKKRIDFATNVYKFGQQAKMEDYNNNIQIEFSSLMNFTSLSNGYIGNEENEKAIFEPNINETIVIKGKEPKGYKLPDGKIQKEISCTDGVLNAVIATNGDVIIDGDVTFNGAIVCNGNLDISNSSHVNINYDSEIVDRIQYNNEELFKNVFGGNIIYNDNSNSSNEFKQDITTNYDLKKFLKTEFWKINK